MPDSTPSRSTPALPTTARLSLGHHSPAQSTADHLTFQFDHALARDAVHTPLDLAALQRGLTQRGLQPVSLHSAAPDRRAYLLRPDLGRTLHPESARTLQQIAAQQLPLTPTDPSCLGPVVSNGAQRTGETPVLRAATPSAAPPPPPAGRAPYTCSISVLFLLADGLSALALEHHALPLLDAALSLIPNPSSLVPLVQNARVALADPIGQILGAQITVLLIGERPGLSSPDSLGCYITWSPRPGRTDAERNCISNIRGPEGLSYAEAAHRIAHYIHQAQRLHTTGITLKDPATTHLL